MMIGLVQPGTSRGTFLQMIGSRKITPPRMLRVVPFGGGYISCRMKFLSRAASGGVVGRAIHFVQVEFLHPRLVGRDGRALHRHANLLGRLRRLDGDPVAGLV